MPNEPSMEEILSSIKRIISDEDRALPRAPRRSAPRVAASAAEEDSEEAVLELTEALPAEADNAAASADADITEKKHEATSDESASKQEERMVSSPAKADPKPTQGEERNAKKESAPTAAPVAQDKTAADPVLSDMSANAARNALSTLSHLLVRDDEGQSNTLEGLVREMLRPMLKEWLDANLPDLVETMVKREIDRITGRI